MRINPKQSTANFKAEDISGPISLQIASVREVTFGRGDTKYAVDFVNESRSLVLNQTNLLSLCGFFGDDTDKWIAKRIELFTQMTSFDGIPVLGIRVRQPVDAVGNGQVASAKPASASLGNESNLPAVPQTSAPRIQLDNPTA